MKQKRISHIDHSMPPAPGLNPAPRHTQIEGAKEVQVDASTHLPSTMEFEPKGGWISAGFSMALGALLAAALIGAVLSIGASLLGVSLAVLF